MAYKSATEDEIEIEALGIAARQPNGFVATSDLIEELENLFQPQGKDAEIIDGRNDTYFSQKVRNIISHKDYKSSIFSKGYASYDGENKGIRITQKGRDYISKF